ncbi:hypothetical protein [Streptomyces sp. NPDC059566]|uniref:hypothetical protein n=1 Tax=Streptomyces sp. NPDC059566 TaxID=3346866 RepID=UPI0036C0A59A
MHDAAGLHCSELPTRVDKPSILMDGRVLPPDAGDQVPRCPAAPQPVSECKDVLFAKDRYFLKLMDHGIEIERRARDGLLKVGKKFDVLPTRTTYASEAGADAPGVHPGLLVSAFSYRLLAPVSASMRGARRGSCASALASLLTEIDSPLAEAILGSSLEIPSAIRSKVARSSDASDPGSLEGNSPPGSAASSILMPPTNAKTSGVIWASRETWRGP